MGWGGGQARRATHGRGRHLGGRHGRRGYTHLDGQDQTQLCHQPAGSPEAGHWTPLSLFTICNVRDLRTPSQVVTESVCVEDRE